MDFQFMNIQWCLPRYINTIGSDYSYQLAQMTFFQFPNTPESKLEIIFSWVLNWIQPQCHGIPSPYHIMDLSPKKSIISSGLFHNDLTSSEPDTENRVLLEFILSRFSYILFCYYIKFFVGWVQRNLVMLKRNIWVLRNETM